MSKYLKSTYCHEIQIGLGTTSVPDFENLTLIGRATRMALHIRGLPIIDFKALKLVAHHYLNIPLEGVKEVVETLAEIEFVKIHSEGKTIKSVLPTIPYYEKLHQNLSEYGEGIGYNEPEELTLDILKRLAQSPDNSDALIDKTGCDRTLFERISRIGDCGNYLKNHKARGKNILISPNFFSENFDLYADLVAKSGARSIQRLLSLIKEAQGYPLSLIEKNQAINGNPVTSEEIAMLKRLAYDGAIKPPSITTQSKGQNFFLFTPTPAGAALDSTKKDIYEKAMAVVSAIRQGQFLPNQYAIRSPGAIIYTLINNKQLKKSTTEANGQYKNLVHLRIARLEQFRNGFAQLQIIDTPENIEALKMAQQLINDGSVSGAEVDENARKALQQPIEHTESIIASGELKKTHSIELSEEQQMNLDLIYLQ